MAECPKCGRSATLLFEYAEYRGIDRHKEGGRDTARPIFDLEGEMCWPCYRGRVAAHLILIRKAGGTNAR